MIVCISVISCYNMVPMSALIASTKDTKFNLSFLCIHEEIVLDFFSDHLVIILTSDELFRADVLSCLLFV